MRKSGFSLLESRGGGIVLIECQNARDYRAVFGTAQGRNRPKPMQRQFAYSKLSEELGGYPETPEN